MDSENNNNNIYNLLVKLVDNQLNNQEREFILEWSRTNPDAVRIYSNFMQDYALVQKQISSMVDKEYGSSEDSEFDAAVLDALKDSEENAPMLEISKKQTEISEVEEFSCSDIKKNIYRVYSILVSAAAVFMILFVVYANVFPPQLSEEVAVVKDQLDVDWDISSDNLKNGEKLMTNQLPYVINKGLIKLSYDEGVDIVIEGPAKFTIEKKGLDFAYGRLYSYVTEIGHGFTVDTPNNRFIDLGTEFGVFVNQNLTSELHVFTGEVQYYSGLKGAPKVSKTIRADNARRFDTDSGQIQIIRVEENVFARDVNSKTGIIWRGQNSIDLADVIGGGNGLGTGHLNYGVDFKDGKSVPVEEEIGSLESYGYVLAEHPFIDGVFIPDGEDGDVQITSTNVIYDGFPDTNGKWYIPISNNSVIKKKIKDSKTNVGIEKLLLNGENLVSSLSSRICLHPNVGITFDMDVIRRSCPNIDFRSFAAKFGFIQSYSTEQADVDLYVLLDGKMSGSYTNYLSSESPLDIKVDIEKEDRFLTIVCTEGAENKYDWVLLVNPILTDNSQDN